MGVRGKLFLISLGVIGVAGGVSLVFLEAELREWLLDRVAASLTQQARGAAEALSLAAPPATVAAMEPVADRLGKAMQSRITIIASDGAVLGDSTLTAAEVRGVENHGQRPEVLQAFEAGRGEIRRFSTTMDVEMIYVALPWQAGGQREVVRAAVDLDEVEEMVLGLRVLMLIAGLVGLVAAALLSGLTSHLASRRLRALVSGARERGRLEPRGGDEIGNLAGSFTKVRRELEQAMTELATERDRFETVLESMGEALIALDADLRITLVNPAAVDLLALGDRPAGRHLVEVNRTPALNTLAEQGRREAAAGELDLPGEPRRRILARATPLRGSGGTVVVAHDVTEMRRLERVRRDFVANVSHELRTPVAIIRANAETLLDGALEDTKRAPVFLGAIHRNAERLANLIADLLDLSRIEAGSYRLRLEPLEVDGAAARGVHEVERLAHERRISLAVDVPAGVTVRADAKALDHVLLNLLHNAVKYSDEGGWVEIGAEVQGDQVRIEVRDDGPGIASHHRARLFERFYRVDAGRSREVGGTGLGLAIVKHLVESMGGEVGVEPRHPHGSIFYATLPRAAEGAHEG